MRLKSMLGSLCFVAGATGVLACDDASSQSNDSGSASLCTGLDQVACTSKAGCSWTGAGCGLGDAGHEGGVCSVDACFPPECGRVWVNGAEVCIARPSCGGLSDGDCEATLGCRAIRGRLPTDAPGSPTKYVGCGDGIESPGTMITCTAIGPGSTCWVLPDTGVPIGWAGWSCVDPKTQDECMAQGPYAPEAGPPDASADG